MSDEYVAEISIPIKYQNLPADKILNNVDDEIDVRFRGNGGDIFWLKYFSAQDELAINIQKLDLKKSRYFDKYYILTDQFRNQIANRFDFDHSLLSFGPDTIYLNFESIISKTLEVYPNIEISCKEQYQIYDSLLFNPPKVMVSGPESIIDTLTNIYTEWISLKDLDKNTSINIALHLPVQDEKVSYSAEEVELFIPVEAYTESSIELSIYSKSNEDGITIKTFPEKVTLTYMVAMKDYNRVTSDMFSVTVSYDPEKDKEKHFLRVQVDENPAYINISRIHPDKVEFIIQK